MLILEESVLEVILSAFMNELQPAINGKRADHVGNEALQPFG